MSGISVTLFPKKHGRLLTAKETQELLALRREDREAAVQIVLARFYPDCATTGGPQEAPEIVCAKPRSLNTTLAEIFAYKGGDLAEQRRISALVQQHARRYRR